jgi:hypothetical protein
MKIRYVVMNADTDKPVIGAKPHDTEEAAEEWIKDRFRHRPKDLLEDGPAYFIRKVYYAQ